MSDVFKPNGLKFKKVASEVNRKIVESFSGLFHFCQHSEIPG